MSETVFKKGDKVFCIFSGHGVVIDVWDETQVLPVRVQFDKGVGCVGYTSDGRYYEYLGKTLSFTEYTLHGFSQERPLELPEVGEEIMVSNDDTHWGIKKFVRYNPNYKHPVVCDGWDYKYFKRLR